MMELFAWLQKKIERALNTSLLRAIPKWRHTKSSHFISISSFSQKGRVPFSSESKILILKSIATSINVRTSSFEQHLDHINASPIFKGIEGIESDAVHCINWKNKKIILIIYAKHMQNIGIRKYLTRIVSDTCVTQRRILKDTKGY